MTDIYAPASPTTAIASQNGGWIMHEREENEGQAARMVWTDMQTWEWQNLPLPDSLFESKSGRCVVEPLDQVTTEVGLDFESSGLPDCTGQISKIGKPASIR